MLEDDFTYVLRKALKGHGLAPAEAAKRCGLPESEVLAFSRGRFSAATAHQLAKVLGLDPVAFANHPAYHPRPIEQRGIHRLDLPFGDEQVNAWLISHGDTAILFDTGSQAGSCADALASLSAPPVRTIFITHAHADHTGGLGDFEVPARGLDIDGTSPFAPGQVISCGPLVVRACDLSGHASPALGYHVANLDFPILVTGDALFAGSMGGCQSPERYRHALERLHAVLDSLPDDTLLLPGHGPGTTLGEERHSNPFISL